MYKAKQLKIFYIPLKFSVKTHNLKTLLQTANIKYAVVHQRFKAAILTVDLLEIGSKRKYVGGGRTPKKDKEEERLNKQLTLVLYSKTIVGDGNCLFRAVAD